MPHILIVDDNEMNLELAHDLLALEDGFSVETANSAEQGLQHAASRRPDLILMDLRMPGMSGLDALHALRADAATRDITVAVLTASAMKGDEVRLLEEGFDAYLQKPIDPATFADSVRALLDDSPNT